MNSLVYMFLWDQIRNPPKPTEAPPKEPEEPEEETFDKVEKAVTKYEGEDPKTFK